MCCVVVFIFLLKKGSWYDQSVKGRRKEAAKTRHKTAMTAPFLHAHREKLGMVAMRTGCEQRRPWPFQLVDRPRQCIVKLLRSVIRIERNPDRVETLDPEP